MPNQAGFNPCPTNCATEVRCSAIISFFIMNFIKCLNYSHLIVVSVLMVVGVVLVQAQRQDGDAVIIDGKPNVEIIPRGGSRQFRHVEETQGSTSCVISGDGKQGRCTSFEECFPLRNVIKDKETNLLNQELRSGYENRNCSSVVHSGTSNHPDICCPLPKHLYVNVVSAAVKAPGVDLVRAATCGRGQVAQTKIINGTNTIPGELPWMVVMFGKSGKQTCGGSLISENIVLTAAHCVNAYGAQDVSKIRIHLGDYNIRSVTDGRHEIRGVKRLIKHRFFNMQSFINDIALLRLDKPVAFNNRIQPICLPSSSAKNLNSLVNQRLIVAGWGRTSFKGTTSPILQKVKVRVWTNANCAITYKDIAPAGILNTMICAGDKGLDSCVGDSGGPLMYKTQSGYYEQVGIVSFGKGCGTHPGVYTRVSEYLPWILSNMNK